MEALVVVGLVSNIIQIVDFSSKLLLSSKEIYRSSSGVLTEYADIETAATHLVSLNNKIKDSISATSDNALKRLCESCSSTTDELFAALNMVKVEDKNSKWKSIRKALRSIWTKEKITALEERLARFREEVNLHLILNIREDILELKLDHLKSCNNLDMISQRIIDAIAKQQDVFEAVHETQTTTIRSLHNDVLSTVEDEHANTRRQVVKETALLIKTEFALTHNVLQDIQLTLQNIMIPLTILVALMSRLCISGQHICDIIFGIRSAFPIDTRWTFFQSPYIFEDALGRVYPIPSEYDIDLIRTIIKNKFRQLPGYRQILLGNYELFKTRNTRHLISERTYIQPGATISMAILLNTPSTGTECCPVPDCRSAHYENRQEGGKICNACNTWFDVSSTKRRAFGDVASHIETSDYEWLAEDILCNPISNVLTVETTPYQIEDVSAYRRIKLWITDRMWDDEQSLEAPLDDGLCIFNPAGQVAFTKLNRKYRRGQYSLDDLTIGLEELFESSDPQLNVIVKVKKGPERKWDEVMMVLSSNATKS